MRSLALLLLATCALSLGARAAVVEGVVLDDETGNPLARTQLTLVPLPGTPVEPTSVRAGSRGSFVILSVRPGWYVLRATRRGYAPAEDGQSKPGRPGHAFEVTDDRVAGFHEIKMAHLAAITGTVLDENGIGIPRWQVHIYTAGKPMRHTAQTETDDRGDYRFGSLDPGTYLVRSGPGPLEDKTTVVATYTRAAVELKDAVSTGVHVGQTQPRVTISPVKGKLFTVSGQFLAPPYPGGATLTLITDTGRRDIASGSGERPFSANAIQPGLIELVVSGRDPLGAVCGSYIQIPVDRDMSALRVACNPLRQGGIQVSGVPKPPGVIIRRFDLDGVSLTHQMARDETLIPGHWELSVPQGPYYVRSVRSYNTTAPQAGAWYAFDAGAYTNVSVQLSSNYAVISGTVTAKKNPVTGAPVYVMQTTTGQSWTVRSDPQGNYSLIGLGPGTYSLISSFNLELPEAALTRPKDPDTVTLQDGGSAVQALELNLQ